MALINFDCPECGHNLEVDERGAGFIVKCPECDSPLQIPELPHHRRIRKSILAGVVLLAILVLFAATAWFARQTRNLREEISRERQAFSTFEDGAQAAAIRQDAEIARLKRAVTDARTAARDALADAALDAMDKAEALSKDLETSSRRLLDNHAGERTTLLRLHMAGVVQGAKDSLPTAPVITDVGPGRGIQGRRIVFPILPGPDGQPLRKNAEVTGIEDNKVSVRFPGGSATYGLDELHPGVAAYLPVDPLLVLPRRQWAGEVIRIHQVRTARREEDLAELRRAIEALLPNEGSDAAP